MLLDSLAHVIPDVGAAEHRPYRRAPFGNGVVQFENGKILGKAVDRVNAVASANAAGSSRRFLRNAQVFQSSLENLTLLMIVAIGVVYIVLGVLYESYIHPITILSGLPSAGVGALLTLIIFKVELNIYSFVGLVMLVGW